MFPGVMSYTPAGLECLDCDASDSCVARFHVIHAAISAYEKSQRWQKAVSLLAVTQQSAVLPNIISYYAAISACEMGRQGQQALGLWGGVAAAAVVPDVISYNAAISACVKGQQWQQA